MCIPVLISVCVIKYNNGVLLNNPHSNQIDNGILAFSSTSTQNDIYRIHTKHLFLRISRVVNSVINPYCVSFLFSMYERCYLVHIQFIQLYKLYSEL